MGQQTSLQFAFGSIATGRLPLGGTQSPLWPENRPVSRLCNRAEEYGHAGSSECDPRALASAVEQGKADRAKPPLRPKHVWSIRTKLQIEGRIRDLAMFNLAIDSKLRGCDVVAIRVEDVAAGGYTADRATVRQKRTGWPVRFELSEQTRQAVDDYLKAANKRPGEFLFTGRRGPNRNMTTRQYARLVSEWIGSVGLDPRLFGTHSLRRRKLPLSIGAPAISGPFNSCSGIPRSKAQSDIGGSK
jgi:integrase